MTISSEGYLPALRRSRVATATVNSRSCYRNDTAVLRTGHEDHVAGSPAAALRLAVSADPGFGLAVADLSALTGTPDQQPAGQAMNWERHHIEVVATAAAGHAAQAADLLREHVASVGCDPLAVRITARLQPTAGPGDDFEDLAGQLPRCHATPWPSAP